MRLVALGIIGGMAIANVVSSIQTWPMGDVQIYWEAGERIRSGEPLYPGDAPFRSFRYAPWFAWMWAGFSFLPYWLVAIVWEVALLVACVAVAIPFLRAGVIGLAFAGIMVPLLFAVSAGGNVQALLVMSLLHGIDRRTGPLWIALAASLRATPILFVAVYAATDSGSSGGSMLSRAGSVDCTPAMPPQILKKSSPSFIEGGDGEWSEATNEISPVESTNRR